VTPEQTRAMIMGRGVPRADGRDKVTGRAKYCTDVKPPGLLYARVLSCPFAAMKGAPPPALDAAQKVKGVKTVRWLGENGPHGKLALAVATTPEAADEALLALGVKAQGQPVEANVERAVGRAKAAGQLPPPAPLPEAFRQAEVTAECTVIVNQVQHAPLEPRGATVHWTLEKVTVWESTQGVVMVRDSVANHFRLDRNQVQAICHYCGGGFGIKANFTGAMTILAAELSREFNAPVKLFHSRHAELATGGRGPSYTQITLGARRDGTLVAEHRRGLMSPSPTWYRFGSTSSERLEGVGSVHVSGAEGPLRAPGTPETQIVSEIAMDVMAEKLGMDPLAFRVKNADAGLGQQLQRWFAAGGPKIGWERRQKPAGSALGPVKRGIGLGCGEFAGRAGMHLAEVEVDVETGVARVLRVVAVQDRGWINRLTTESQVYGGVVMGLSWAMFEDRKFDPACGAFLTNNLEHYKLAGPVDIPEIEVILLGQEGDTAGCGEGPVVPIGGAIANAIFNATGKPVRKAPFTPRNLLAALAA
jgi:xanthine dehydrogenase YagR molybdenum-binding subunit